MKSFPLESRIADVAPGFAALERARNLPSAPRIDAQDAPRRGGRRGELQTQMSELVSKMKVAVVYGGDKTHDGSVIYQTHNPRSWKSYEAVAHDISASLSRAGCKDVVLLPDDMRLGQRLREEGVHLAWLNTGGVQGYCAVSHAAATLEMLGVPYVGHEPLSAGILDSKHVFKRQLSGAGVPTARFITWHGAQGPLHTGPNSHFDDVFSGYEGPFIVKPVSGRASLNVEYAPDRYCAEQLAAAVFQKTENHVLIEQYLAGREYCVAICGPTIQRDGMLQRLDSPFTFAHVERVLAADERIFTSMDKKPITGDRVRAMNADAEADVIAQLDRLAHMTFDQLDLETLIRLDVRADENGKLFILEANPKPDLKAPTDTGVTSLIVEGLRNCGMSYDDLIFSLLADRIDVLFSKRRGSAHPLLNLLTPCEG
ncbi:MAG: D-alanyl-alanine synthetase [Pseudomonadota bacterium]